MAMNAARLYTHLSRKMILLETDANDGILDDFMRGEKGLYKLRNFLLCRFCRQISPDPLCSKFCQHLICKLCYDEGLSSTSGCKWCRNKENLSPDHQSTLLIGLFKQLCAILKELITGSIEDTGVTEIKQNFLRFVTDGFVTADIKIPPKEKKENFNKKNLKGQIKIKKIDSSCQTEEKEQYVPYCCKCDKPKINNSSEDLSNDPIAVTAAESSTMKCDKQKLGSGTEQFSDNVSSTVPDTLPRKSTHTNSQSKSSKTSKKLQNGKLIEEDEKIDTDMSSNSIYESISNISIKSERKNRSIFEKFGLALSPPSPYMSPTDSYGKQSKQKRKKSRESLVKENSEPKVVPLKLKMKKINSKNNKESTYLVQYDYEKVISDNVKNSCITQTPDTLPAKNNSNSGERKVKKKATFISDYTIFSDDSDFEPAYQKQRKNNKKTSSKIERDICGCGAGGKVKYFTDICKRSRCPCFAQGRACVNCKCRFCSNPYALEEEEEEETYSDSSCDNLNDNLTDNIGDKFAHKITDNLNDIVNDKFTDKESELIDVEAM